MKYIRDINIKHTKLLFVNWDVIIFKLFRFFFIYPIPSAWTYKQHFKVILKISPNNKTTPQKPCILPKVHPIHSPPDMNTFKKLPKILEKQTPNPIQPAKKHVLTIQLAKSHVLQLQTHRHGTSPWGGGEIVILWAFKFQRFTWVCGRTLQTLEMPSLLSYVIVGVLLARGIMIYWVPGIMLRYFYVKSFHWYAASSCHGRVWLAKCSA